MLQLIGKYRDPDSTEKYIFKDQSGTIEITRINTKEDRDIFCVPSLYGCSLACSFCFLTTMNIAPNLKKISYERIKECLSMFDNSKDRRQISIMGVGDPSLNQEFILQACEEEEMVSIASIFPVELPNMPRNLKIHYSMHSSIQEKRLKIMPSAKVDIPKVLEFLSKHEGKSEIHYTLIQDSNDSLEELKALENLMKQYPVNIKFLDFKESSDLKKSDKLGTWMKHLEKFTTVEFYNPPGEKIQGSCGQFTKVFYQDNYENRKEYQEFKELYAI